MNEPNKIRIGGIDYTMPFLQSLLDTVRGEYPSFSSDLLRLWEDNEREQQRKNESDSIAEREKETRDRQELIDNKKLTSGDD